MDRGPARRPHVPGCGHVVAPAPTGTAACGHHELLAHHGIEGVLHALVTSVDRKDVTAAVELVGGARVEVRGHGGHGSRGPQGGGARSWLTQLWTDPGEYRHEVSMLAVVPADAPGRWTARAHYLRWSVGATPEVHSLGEYDLVVEAHDGLWRVCDLVVSRTWTRGG